MVRLELQPLQPGQGVELVVDPACDIPKEFIQACQEGLQEAAHNGTVAGYPVVAVKLLLLGGELHETDSSELAFKMAGIFAFKQAMEAASPVLPEPVMRVEVETPDEHQGDIIGDLNRRRGNIVDVNKIAFTSIVGQVPLLKCLVIQPLYARLARGALLTVWSPIPLSLSPARCCRLFLKLQIALCAQLNDIIIMSTPRIRIRLKGFDYRVVDQSAVEIVETAKRSGARVTGPVPLPTKVEKLTVNRSVHVKTSRWINLKFRTHKRLIDIVEPTAATVDELKKLNLPAGVDITINV